MTDSVFSPKCDLFVMVSTILLLYFSVLSTTNRYLLQFLCFFKHKSIHSSHVFSISSLFSFQCSLPPYGGHVNNILFSEFDQSTAGADSRSRTFTEHRFPIFLNFIISFDSFTCVSFMSQPIYFLLALKAPSILPEKPLKGSTIAVASDRYFSIKYSAVFGLKIETLLAIRVTLNPCSISDGLHLPTYFNLFNATFLTIFLSFHAVTGDNFPFLVAS